MRIAVDAMGGDHAPGVLVEGAVNALFEFGEDLEIVLVGDEQIIRDEMERRSAAPLDAISSRISVVSPTQLPSSLKLNLSKSGSYSRWASAGPAGTSITTTNTAPNTPAYRFVIMDLGPPLLTE